MSELITPEEFIQSKEFIKALKDIDKGLQDVLKTIGTASAVVKKYHEEVKKGATNQKELTENQKKANDTTKQTIAIEKEQERIEKELAKTKAKLALATSDQNKQLAEEKKKLKEVNDQVNGVTDAEKKRKANIGKYKEDIVKAYVAIQGVILGAKSVYQGLSKIIESTEGLGDKVAITVAGLQAGMDYFAKSLATMDFSNFFSNLSKVYKAGKEYQEAMENIEDANWAYRIKQADTGLEILQKKATARAEKDKEKKKILIDEILALEQQLEDDKVKIAEKGLKAVLDKTSAINEVSTDEIIKFIAKNKEFMATLNRQAEDDLFTFAANQITFLKGRVHDYEAYLGDLKEGSEKYIEIKEKLDTTKKDLADLELKKKLQKVSKSEIDLIVKYYEELKSGQGQTEERMQRFLAMRIALEQELSTPKKDDKAGTNTVETDKKKGEEILQNFLSRKNKERDAENQFNDYVEEDRNKRNDKRLAEEEQITDDIIAQKEREKDAFEKAEKDKQAAIEETKMLQIDAANALFDLGAAFNSREIAELESKKDKEIKAAGDNAKKKERIEAEYNKKIAAIKRKQAITDKVQALFNIGMNTAIGVTKATAQLGAFGLPVVTWIKILGALQAAAVIATPLPKFFKGVKDFKGGPAVVGEKGMELVETPKGSFLTPDKATTMLLPEHSTVHTHEKTIEKLKEMDGSKVNELIKEQRLTRKALANQVHHSTKIDERGARFLTHYGNSTTEWINKNFR
jgi:hypothetical protein